MIVLIEQQENESALKEMMLILIVQQENESTL